jgi:hypothetical protein
MSNSKSLRRSGPLSARISTAKFDVPAAEKNELFAIVQTTKGDIVTG